MFSEGQIVYFSPFHFKNGDPVRNKYFIIIRNIGDSSIIASLPTSNNKAPSFIVDPHGCINHDEHCFNCYLFEPNRIIGRHHNFSFVRPTFVYGNEVEDYDMHTMRNRYAIENVDYVIEDTLLDHEYLALMECLKKSTSVKRKIKRLLN